MLFIFTNPAYYYDMDYLSFCHSLFLSVCGQNANRTKCQPDIFSGLISVVGILSIPTFWLAFCPDHLNISTGFGILSES